MLNDLEVEGLTLSGLSFVVVLVVVAFVPLILWGAWTRLRGPRPPQDGGDSVSVLRYKDTLIVWDTIPVVVDKSTVDLYS